MGGKRKEKLIESINAAVRAGGITYLPVIRAKVESVDESKYMIKAVDLADSGIDETPVYEASLRAVVIKGDLGFIQIPEKGSTVAIAFANNSKEQAVVIACSKVAKVIMSAVTEIEYKIDGSTAGKIKITDSGVALGAGSEKMVLGESFKEQFDVEINVMTALQNALNAWAPVSQDGGAALKTALTSWLTMTMANSNNILSEKHKVD